MAVPAIASATGATAPSSTITTNLFHIPTRACSLALFIAGLQTGEDEAPQQTAAIAFTAQAVSNPDIAGIGVSGFTVASGRKSMWPLTVDTSLRFS